MPPFRSSWYVRTVLSATRVPKARCVAMVFLFALLGGTSACAQQQKTSTRLDLTDAAVVSLWQPTHDVSKIEATPDGMRIQISGSDPYVTGPPVQPPVASALWIRLRVFSQEGGLLQVFFFSTHPTEERSARTNIPRAKWIDVAIPAPAMAPNTRLRIDPPGTRGTCTIAWVELAPRAVPTLPQWPRPAVPALVSTIAVRSTSRLASRPPEAECLFGYGS